LWDDWQARYLAAVSQVARHISAAGMLRRGVDQARAADVLYTLAGCQTQFAEWLSDSIRRLLLLES
jgi:hypothetical protein